MLFGVDLRSLAAFRIATASLILLDLWYRSRELSAYFTDQGILPRQARIGLIELGDEFGRKFDWSLHMLSGQYWAQLMLILIAFWFAVSMLLGYRTRLAAVMSWLLLLSLDSRNPAILASGDVLLRCMLFWSLFLPLGARASLDRLLQLPASEPISKSPGETAVSSSGNLVINVASCGLLMQLAMMYFFSALFKTHPAWHTHLTAVYYALNCDAFAAPLALTVRQYPALMKALTLGSYLLELIGPVVVFSPFWTARIRLVVIALFWSFHTGLALTMTIGMFPAICMVGWLVFLPGSFWDGIAQTRMGERVQNAAAHLSERLRVAIQCRSWLFSHPADPRPQHGRVASFVCNGVLAFLLVYTVIWNIRELDVRYWEPRILPRQMNGIARALGLDQNWAMFSPIPRTEDGWLIMLGTLEDGTEVNLWQPGHPIPWDKPQLVSATYLTQRWRKYLDNLTTDQYVGYRDYFCEWLTARWNEEHAVDDPTQRVAKVELLHRIELTPPPGRPIPEPETKQLYVYYPIYYD